MLDSTLGIKRQKTERSSIGEYPVDSSGILDHKSGHPFRSINTALVLLVLALGAICEHKNKIPDLAIDPKDYDAASPPSVRSGQPHSPQNSSPIVTTPTGLPSPDADLAHLHRRSSSSDDGHSIPRTSSIKAKNLDRIKGLAYFALATDIIGNQVGGNSLQHVHANILASLYHGQLGRVLESHSYLTLACRSLHSILRP